MPRAGLDLIHGIYHNGRWICRRSDKNYPNTFGCLEPPYPKTIDFRLCLPVFEFSQDTLVNGR